jgi:hypothetical protein
LHQINCNRNMSDLWRPVRPYMTLKFRRLGRMSTQYRAMSSSAACRAPAESRILPCWEPSWMPQPHTAARAGKRTKGSSSRPSSQPPKFPNAARYTHLPHSPSLPVSRLLLQEEEELPPAVVGPVVADVAAPGTSVAVAVEAIPRPALRSSSHGSGAVCGGRPGAPKIKYPPADMQMWCLQSVSNSRPFRAPNSTVSTCPWPFSDPWRPSTKRYTLVYDQSLPS